MRRVAGVWVDVELDIPAPTGLSAVYTILAADNLLVYQCPTDRQSTIYARCNGVRTPTT